MQTVILYGLRGAGRREVEYFLSDDYKIIGYSDSDIQYNSYSYINYIKFIRQEELNTISYDCLIITPKDLKIANEIKSKLIQGG